MNLKIAEEIKAGGESSCKPNRTRTVTTILESAMNKEEGNRKKYAEINLILFLVVSTSLAFPVWQACSALQTALILI